MKVENSNTNKLSYFDSIHAKDSDGGGFGAILTQASRPTELDRTNRVASANGGKTQDQRDPIDGREQSDTQVEQPEAGVAQADQSPSRTDQPDPNDGEQTTPTTEQPKAESPNTGEDDPTQQVAGAAAAASKLVPPPGVQLESNPSASASQQQATNVADDQVQVQPQAQAVASASKPAESAAVQQVEPAEQPAAPRSSGEPIATSTHASTSTIQAYASLTPVADQSTLQQDAEQGEGQSQQRRPQPQAQPMAQSPAAGAGELADDSSPLDRLQTKAAEASANLDEANASLSQISPHAQSAASTPAPTNDATAMPTEVQAPAPAAPIGDAPQAPVTAGAANPQAALLEDVDSPPITARVLRGLHGAVNQRGGTLTMLLTPPELGELRINVQFDGGVVRATFQAGHEQVASLLRQQMGMLRHALEGRGLTVETLQVQTPGPLGMTHTDSSQAQTDQSPTDGRSRGAMDDGQQAQTHQQEQTEDHDQFHDELDLVV